MRGQTHTNFEFSQILSSHTVKHRATIMSLGRVSDTIMSGLAPGLRLLALLNEIAECAASAGVVS